MHSTKKYTVKCDRVTSGWVGVPQRVWEFHVTRRVITLACGIMPDVSGLCLSLADATSSTITLCRRHVSACVFLRLVCLPIDLEIGRIEQHRLTDPVLSSTNGSRK